MKHLLVDFEKIEKSAQALKKKVKSKTPLMLLVCIKNA